MVLILKNLFSGDTAVKPCDRVETIKNASELASDMLIAVCLRQKKVSEAGTCHSHVFLGGFRRCDELPGSAPPTELP